MVESSVDTADGRDEQIEKLQHRGQQLMAVLGEAVTVLMRDPRYRHHSLLELEWSVIPALVTDQYMFMRGKVRAQGQDAVAPAGLTVPIGIALWASVSDAVAEKLKRQRNDGAGYRLAPQDWKSGDNLWLLVLSGPEKAIPALREQLNEAFASRPVEFGLWAGGRPVGRAKSA